MFSASGSRNPPPIRPAPWPQSRRGRHHADNCFPIPPNRREGNRGHGLPACNGDMGPCGVVSPIGGDLGDGAADLCQQIVGNLNIAQIGGGNFDSNDVLPGFIDRQVDLCQVRRLPTPC